MSSRAEATASEVTQLLQEVSAGNRQALDRLVPLVYDELRRIADRQLRRDRGSPTLSPTVLVHDAYLKLAASVPQAEHRTHFVAVAARAMRQVLVESARRRGAGKRGAGVAHTTLSHAGEVVSLDADELLALDAALDKLPERQRQIVELRYFGGMEEREIAALLEVSDRTVRREWVKARAWLYRELYLSA